MHPPLRLPAILSAVAVLTLLGSGVSLRAADDDAAARKAAAAELVAGLHLQQFVESTAKRLLQSLDMTVDRLEKQSNAKPEQVTEANTSRDELHTMVTQQVNWEAMKADLTQMYADDFTVDELKEIGAFYHTPAGTKLAEKQPELNEKASKAIQQRASAIAPAVQQKIRAIAMKLRPVTPPTPASLVPGPVGPAVPTPGVVTPAVPVAPPPAPSAETPKPATPPAP